MKPSWYPTPDLNSRAKNYIRMIESIYSIQHPDRSWHKIKLTPHQIDFHIGDIAFLGSKAKSEIIIKSRNTSLTTNSIIRLLQSTYNFRDITIPVIRMTEPKVKELIASIKLQIRHMQPLKLSDGSLYPFDPSTIRDDNSLKVVIPDRNVTIQAYSSLSKTSIDLVRGLRTITSFIDEASFIPDFDDLLPAVLESSTGSNEDGSRFFQTTIGSTIVYGTQFYDWYKRMNSMGKLDTWRIREWQVFNPKKFNPEVDPIQQNLTPIVWWHDIKILSEKWRMDKRKFLQEYQCLVSTNAETLYDTSKVISLATEENHDFAIPGNTYYMGIDPAADGNDYFSIAIFSLEDWGMKQRYLFNQKHTKDPEQMLQFIYNLMDKFNITKCRIDGNDLGMYVGNALKNKYGINRVEVMRGATRITPDKNFTVPLKEYLHTNLLQLINTGKIRFINNELLFDHFSVWKNDYTAERSRELGHGDTVIACGLACLPLNWKFGGRTINFNTNSSEPTELDNGTVRNKVLEFQNWDLKKRMNFYKKGYY